MKGTNYMAWGLIALTALSMGCRRAPQESITQARGVEGYAVRLHYIGGQKDAAEIKIFDRNTPEEVLYAKDIDGDGRVDRMRLSARKGSKLEELASFRKVNEILAEAKKK